MPFRLLTPLILILTALLGACGGGGSGGSSSPAASGGSTTPVAATLGTVQLVAAGANHSVALTPKAAASGPAYLWGDNHWGQIGDGTLDTPKSAPLLLKNSSLPIGTTWKAVAAGEAHTLAIRSDGTLWAWGFNSNGQIGDGTTGTTRTSPVKIGTLTNWIAVAAGDAHSVALKTTAPQIMTWGQNAYGQLGLGTAIPTGVNPAFGVVLADAAVPTAPTKAITVVSGSNVISAILFAGLPWTAIAAGGKHSMAMRTDGALFSWGDNSFGQLGQSIPVNVSVATQLAPIGSGTLPAVAMASGRYHALAILNDHTLFAWGANSAGQLGDRTVNDQVAAVQVPVNTAMANTADWFTVAAGGAHTLAIKQDQTLWAWGSNSDGQLGDGTTTNAVDGPIPVGVGKRWLAVAAGRFHSMAIDTDGKLWVWGRNAEGQLGLGTAGAPVLVPTLLP